MQEAPRTSGRRPIRGMVMLYIPGELQLLHPPVKHLHLIGAGEDSRVGRAPGPPGEWLKDIQPQHAQTRAVSERTP